MKAPFLFLVLAWYLLMAPASPAAQTERKTRNVVLIVTDGLRWQEVFGGADSSLMNKEHGGVADTTALRERFWRGTAEERRSILLPFFWNVFARRGQVYGNPAKASIARVSNGQKFSYPGYNELLTGFVDARITRNDFGPNPNLTVFEWLGRRPGFSGKVAAFGTWDAFRDIFNARRSGIFMRVGWEQPTTGPLTGSQAMLDKLYRTTTRLWDDVVYDSFMHEVMMDYVRRNRPRVLFVGYGETDIWSHDGRYDLLLGTAHQFDRFVSDLWSTMQRMPEYRGKTTFIITTDHGRGDGVSKWRNHGRDVEGAEDIWIAVLGPDTPALGEVANATPVTQGQIAATLAALLGENYGMQVRAAAQPISSALSARP